MSEDNLTHDEQVAIFNFDPFDQPEPAPSDGGEAPPAESPAASPPAEPAPVEPRVETRPSPEAPPASIEPQAPAVPPPPSPEIVALRAEIEQLKRERMAPPEPTPAPRAPAPAEEPLPAYEYEIPAQLIDGLAHEDPRHRGAALKVLVSSIGKEIHRQVREEMETKLNRVGARTLEQFQLQQEESQRRNAIRADLFQHYPELQRPELGELLRSVTRTVIAESGLTEWSPTLRDLVGTRTLGLLGARRSPPTVPASPPPNARPAAPAPPPMNAGNGARPIAAPRRSDVDDIWDTFMGQG